jgi:hypothetical protein
LPEEMRRLKLLEDEHSKLKKLVADLSLDRAMLQAILYIHAGAPISSTARLYERCPPKTLVQLCLQEPHIRREVDDFQLVLN